MTSSRRRDFPRRFFDVDDPGVTRDVDVIGDLR